ncbi:MAG: hypothetical protein JNK82_22985 [Myxococcaceae bacterium]|nr:hypothetical protein [Myxococcaceae bacterium]
MAFLFQRWSARRNAERASYEELDSENSRCWLHIASSRAVHFGHAAT